MGGPLQDLLDEEQALKQKLKERRNSALATGYERRNITEPGQVQKARDARRASVPEVNISGPSAKLESLMRPTALTELRKGIVADKRNGVSSDVSVVKEKPEDLEETEESRAKWEKFHHRSTIFQQDKDKYLENLRKRKEAKEMEGCTFTPAPRRSSSQAGNSSMFDRARQMEIKKQERMAKIRQELFDKEMAQCSFTPSIVERPSGVGDRGYDPSSRRPSANGGDRHSLMSRPSVGIAHQSGHFANPANVSGRQRGNSAPRYGNRSGAENHSSEGSEYWDGDDECRDDEVSQGSDAREAADVTIMPMASGSAKAAAMDRPPRAPNAATSAADEEAQQLKIMQRLQERRQLLEETLSPDRAHPAPFDFAGAANFSAAIRQRSASFSGAQGQDAARQDPLVARRESAPAAAVAEAVERMEGLLLGNYGDLSDLDDSILSEEEDDYQNGDQDSELGELELELEEPELLSAEAPVLGLGGKPGKVFYPPSPTRGGC